MITPRYFQIIIERENFIEKKCRNKDRYIRSHKNWRGFQFTLKKAEGNRIPFWNQLRIFFRIYTTCRERAGPQKGSSSEQATGVRRVFGKAPPAQLVVQGAEAGGFLLPSKHYLILTGTGFRKSLLPYLKMNINCHGILGASRATGNIDTTLINRPKPTV